MEMPVPGQAIAVFPVFPLLTDFVCLLTYEFCLSLWKIARCSVILLLPLLPVIYLIDTVTKRKFKHHSININEMNNHLSS